MRTVYYAGLRMPVNDPSIAATAMAMDVPVLAFMLPSSDELMDATVASLREHRITVWSKHGVMARSDLVASSGGEGLTNEESAELVRKFGVDTSLF